MTEIECVVYGRVQGVGYRDYVLQAAQQCDVVGYVRNESDGTVRVVAQGAPESAKAFIEYLHEGSVMARVERVSIEWRSPEQVYEDFSLSR